MPPSIAPAVVMNLPLSEMKKPVCVRSTLPDESKTLTQMTEGRTLFSSLDKSRDETCSAGAADGWLVDGDPEGGPDSAGLVIAGDDAG
jgi:hypothetical protein